jgi:hypothetical protein
MLAGGKPGKLGAPINPEAREPNPGTCYQGMIFLIPFFFLLVDSVLESAFSPFAG